MRPEGTSRAARGGWSALLASGNVGRLFLVCFGVWLHAADSLMVATMMPAIVAGIGGTHFVAWTIALYEIGSIAAGASAAVLSIRYGLGKVMTAAALTYMVGCGVSALAPEMWVMLVGRLAQGVGGGGLVGLSFVAVTRLFARTLMPRAMAAVSALWGISAFIGPLAGGLFADAGLWRGGFWFFAAQAAILAACLGSSSALRSAVGKPVIAGRLPVRRLAVLSLGVLAVAASGVHPSLVDTPLLVGAGIVLLGLFLRMDGRHEESRLLPLRPLNATNGVGAALRMVLCFSAATIAFSVYGPLLITQLHGVSALVAGYLVAASSIGWSVMSILVASAEERHDGALILSGMAVLTASIIGFMFAVPFGPLWLVLVCAVSEGIGFGMSWTFILRRVTALAPEGDTERASSAMPTLQQLGYALGAAYVGIVANAAGIGDRIDPAAAKAVGFWIFAASLPLAAIGLHAAWRFVSFRGRAEGVWADA